MCAMEKVWTCASTNMLIAPPTNPVTHMGWEAIKKNWEAYWPKFSLFSVSMVVATRAQASLLLVPSGSLHVRVPRSVTTTPGSPVHFVATATDEQDQPLSLSVAGMPEGARFDPATGLYEWTPTDRDLGSSKISFSARNSLDAAVTKTVTVNVVSGEPVLRELRNGAGAGAVAACSPGALAALVGTSLAGSNTTDAVRVLINGSEASVTQISAEQVQFVCPALAPGSEMGMAVEVGGHGPTNCGR